MIHIGDLTEKDKGRMVIYCMNGTSERKEEGIITNWNDTYIFVRYKGDLGSKATYPKELDFCFK